MCGVVRVLEDLIFVVQPARNRRMGDDLCAIMECGGLPPLWPRRTGRTSPRPVFGGCGSWHNQSGGKPPHSKIAFRLADMFAVASIVATRRTCGGAKKKGISPISANIRVWRNGVGLCRRARGHVRLRAFGLVPFSSSDGTRATRNPTCSDRVGWVRDEDLRAAVPAAVVPAPAADLPRRGRELLDVAVHVVNPPGIGAIRTDLHRLLEVGSLRCPVVGPIPVKVRLRAAQLVAKRRGRRRSRAARVFPLRLGRQPVRPSRGQPARVPLQVRQLPAELRRIVVAHVVDRVPISLPLVQRVGTASSPSDPPIPTASPRISPSRSRASSRWGTSRASASGRCRRALRRRGCLPRRRQTIAGPRARRGSTPSGPSAWAAGGETPWAAGGKTAWAAGGKMAWGFGCPALIAAWRRSPRDSAGDSSRPNRICRIGGRRIANGANPRPLSRKRARGGRWFQRHFDCDRLATTHSDRVLIELEAVRAAVRR